MNSGKNIDRFRGIVSKCLFLGEEEQHYRNLNFLTNFFQILLQSPVIAVKWRDWVMGPTDHYCSTYTPHVCETYNIKVPPLSDNPEHRKYQTLEAQIFPFTFHGDHPQMEVQCFLCNKCHVVEVAWRQIPNEKD